MKTLIITTLDRDPSALPEARERLAPLARTLALTPYQEMILNLLTTEVVSNEIKHGHSTKPIALRVTDEDGYIRVAVEADGHFFMPQDQHPTEDSESGRGIMLIEKLAERSGVEEHDGYVTSWFDLICSEI